MAISGKDLSSGIEGESVFTLVGAQGFTKEQCDQLIQMFQSLQGTHISSSEPIAAANLAGMRHALFFLTSLLSNLTKTPWILDSGFTQHMTFEIHLLHDLRVFLTPLLVNFANSCKVKAYDVGNILLSPGMKLSNVLHVLDFKHNLLSVSQFVNDMNYNLLFTKAGCILQAPLMRKEPLFGETTTGLYVLKYDTSILGIHSIKSPVSASFSSSSRYRLPGSLSCVSLVCL